MKRASKRAASTRESSDGCKPRTSSISSSKSGITEIQPNIDQCSILIPAITKKIFESCGLKDQHIMDDPMVAEASSDTSGTPMKAVNFDDKVNDEKQRDAVVGCDTLDTNFSLEYGNLSHLSHNTANSGTQLGLVTNGSNECMQEDIVMRAFLESISQEDIQTISLEEGYSSSHKEQSMECDFIGNIDKSFANAFDPKLFARLKKAVSLTPGALIAASAKIQREVTPFSLPEGFTPTATGTGPTSDVESISSAKPGRRQEKKAYRSVICRFCRGHLRAVDKHREDGKFAVQCCKRTCLKFNGWTDDMTFIRKIKRPKSEYGWYLSDPMKFFYKIHPPKHGESEKDKKPAFSLPIVENGYVAIRCPGQKKLCRLL